MTVAPVRFAPASTSAFLSDVKREVAAHFESRGLSEKANLNAWLRGLFVLALIFVPWSLVLASVLTGWAALAACIVMGAGMAGVGFCVAHDAQHGSWSSKAWVNRVVGLTFDLMGANGWFWRLTHNRLHHTFTNVHGIDEDITVTPAVRMSPGTPRLRIHRWQHLFAWPLYALATINWVVAKDVDYLLRKRIGPYEPVQKPRTLWLAVLLGKVVNIAWTVVIPVLVLKPSVGAFLAGFLAMHATAGLILGIVFQMAHAVEETEFPVPNADGTLPDPWAVHQMRTTADFARGNRLLGWYVGGLNFQIEHHLFSHICSIHYPAISPIVKACAARHGLPFHENPSVWKAVRSHYRLLRRLGLPQTAPAQS